MPLLHFLKAVFLFSFLLALPSPIFHDIRPFLIVWNVGQGQWVTLVRDQECRHFDMGGEKFNLSPIRKLCGDRLNSLYITHGDQDHIAYVDWGRKNLRGLCILARPREELSPRKVKMLAAVPNCPTGDNNIRDISVETRATDANSLAHVFLIQSARGGIVIPGDSPIKAENSWSENLISQVPILILGHHGSRTSTGELLLSRLPNLKIAIASARKRRYGHPHIETIERLHQVGVGILPTEIWGTIRIEL